MSIRTQEAPVLPADGAGEAAAAHDRVVVFDPRLPVMPTSTSPADGKKLVSRQNQRQRRSLILAAIRRLLIEEGYKGVTVRRIAETSGYVVQTIYNLVGPRDHAIVEAIADYTSHVARMAPFAPDDPAAVIKIIAWQGQSVALAPEFTRQVCLIYFSGDRHIFYRYRDRQVRSVHSLLAKQKRIGVLRRDVNCRDLAQDLMSFSSIIFIEWADRSFPMSELTARIRSGYTHILASAISPRLGGLAALPFCRGHGDRTWNVRRFCAIVNCGV
jgi:AcrR family transcriptional regulator